MGGLHNSESILEPSEPALMAWRWRATAPPGGAFVHMPCHWRLPLPPAVSRKGAGAWAPAMTLARSVLESALHFPAIDTGAGGTGAGGGGTSCLSARPLVRSGAGGPDGSLAGCSEGGHPTFRPVSSEKRGTTGSHLEPQLLGSRGPPTALMLRTSSCSTVVRLAVLARLDGGPAGSEGGAPPLLRDVDSWEGGESGIELVSSDWACSPCTWWTLEPCSLPRASRKARCNPRFTWTLICRSTFALSRERNALARSRERREWRR